MSQRIPLDCLWFDFEFSFVCCSYFLFSFQSILWLSGILFFVLFIFMHTARNDEQSELIDRAHALNTNFVSSFFYYWSLFRTFRSQYWSFEHIIVYCCRIFLSRNFGSVSSTHTRTQIWNTPRITIYQSRFLFWLNVCSFFNDLFSI